MERLASMFQENRVAMTFTDLLNTAITVGHAVLLGLGFTLLVMIMVGWSVKRTFRTDAQNNKFKYWNLKCSICGMNMWGTTQYSLHKTYGWHVLNRHPDAE
jgi:hypothetical protein